MGLTFYIVTFDRGTYLQTGVPKPYHWAFFIQTHVSTVKNAGIAHQLHGMPGAFFYAGPEDVVVDDDDDWAPSCGTREQLEIGVIEEDQLAKVHALLKTCRIDESESSGWNCQDWTLDGFSKLRAEGLVDASLTPEIIRNWLRER